LGDRGTAYLHCGFDQPLSSNSRSQNRVAEPGARASRRLKQRPGNGHSKNRSRGRQLVTLEDAGRYTTKLPKAEHEAAEWQAGRWRL
jgi:hypothetical protein